MPGIHVDHWGTGPPVLLVHGSITSGEATWAAQRPGMVRSLTAVA